MWHEGDNVLYLSIMCRGSREKLTRLIDNDKPEPGMLVDRERIEVNTFRTVYFFIVSILTNQIVTMGR